VLRIKRGEGGNIDLDLLQAKSSEMGDEEDQGRDNHEEEGKELTEEEVKQREREKERKEGIHQTFRQ